MIKTVLLLILAFAGVLFGNTVFGILTNELLFTNSVLSVFVFVVIFLLLQKALASPATSRVIFRADTAGLCGILFTLAMTVGRQLENDENLTVSFTFITAVIVWSLITSILLRHVWESIPIKRGIVGQDLLSDNDNRNIDYVFAGGCRISVDVLTFLGMVASYVIILLAVYPGFFVYDAVDEWIQVETGNYTTHHPLPHVLVLGGTIKLIYKLTGSYNFGIAFYVFLQLLFFAFLFTFILRDLRRETGSRKSQLFFTLYYMFFPVVSMYVLCTTKDSLFSAFLVLFFFLTRKLILHTEAFWESRFCPPLYIGSAVLMMCLRYNALYAFLVFVFLTGLYYRHQYKKNGVVILTVKKRVLLNVIPMVAVIAINAVLPVLLHASPSEKQEMLTVPISQLARVCYYDKEELDGEDIKLLEEYIPEDCLNKYTARLSDNVKIGFNNPFYKENPLRFWALWARVGRQHPLSYINAWLYTSYGFWYPDAVINVYQGHQRYTYTYEESSYFAYETEEPGERDSKIPFLDTFFKKLSLELTQQKIPVISMLFSPGFMFFLYVFVTGFLIHGGHKKRAFAYLLPGLIWLTYLLGPTYLVRYVVFMWFAFPILVTDFCQAASGNAA